MGLGHMSSGQLKCVLIGDESLLVQCAEIVRAHGNAIATIVTDSSPIRDWAESLGISVCAFDGDVEQQLARVDYDWLFSAANLRIIPDALWRNARQGAANFHDGPLPRYAGLNAPAWAIMEGEASHGVTWHALTAGVDEGDIYSQRIIEISPDETALTLNTKCFEAGIATFEEMLSAIEGGMLAPRPQDLSQRSYYAKDRRPSAGGTLRFDWNAQSLSHLVRGLDFGSGYANPLARAKVRTDEGLFAVTKFEVVGQTESQPAGKVISVSNDGAVVATADHQVLVQGIGLGRSAGKVLSSCLLQGMRLPTMTKAEGHALDEAVARAARFEGRFRKAIKAARDVDLPGIKAWSSNHAARAVATPVRLPVPTGSRAATIAAFFARFSGQDSFDFAYVTDAIVAQDDQFAGYFAASIPFHIETLDGETAQVFEARTGESLGQLRDQGTYMSDLAARVPGLIVQRLTIGLAETTSPSQAKLIEGTALTFVLSADETFVLADQARIGDRDLADMLSRLSIFANAFAIGDKAVSDLPLMSEEERQRVLYGWNETARDHDRTVCVHMLIERQAELTPDAIAVAYLDRELSYRELDERANRVANRLIELGVKPDTLVGLHISRSPELVIGALAIQKAGGAYVPLDPMLPADRLALMVEDSGAPIVLGERTLDGALPLHGAQRVNIEDILLASGRAERPRSGVISANLAYMIYTSGSTGRPKGVMVEHRNVANFFVGMDDRIAIDEVGQPVWLAVTSLSFDISVLELFWTLARGFKVVIHASEVHDHKNAAATAPRRRATGKAPMDFSLFYWGNDDGAGPAKYRLLLEGAKFADEHGFQALWTPERHFHAFGGPYPNPAVTGAAVAAVTKNLAIRAGSCVLPLHHPARVAEEWAVLDNISNGRVGLAFASGWMPEDFVLRPENAPPHNKSAMLRDIDTVRRLWRGEKVDFDLGAGTIGVVTQPRPVQKELPVWITTAGNPETYREAGRMGANVLTHLLGQSIEDLAGKIRVYREALAEAGHDPSAYKVTLMLHTLLGEDREEVRERARGPMKDYLRSAAALIKQYAWAFPAFKKPQGVAQPMDIDLQSLQADELDAILEFAFLRYFEDSGLFGTVEDALERVDQISAIGVDEVACLIDYGVPSDIVLERLKPLADVVARGRRADVDDALPQSALAADIAAHGVTYLQCTPSMARMFLVNEEDRQALKQVRHLLIGGEALQASLLDELRKVTTALIENMYGPTETTIWSSTVTADLNEGVVPLGKPIANTQLYVLDAALRPVAPGMAGELVVGGEGVARGYFGRDELTRERFLPNLFANGRMYRTGDLVRYTTNGVLEFLGRIDHQVKVRGYRIELGEIESRIADFPGIAETVVVAREDRADDVRIVAYLRLRDGRVDENALRAHLAKSLPEYMVPAHFVTLDAFPLTPNAKVDRKALPRPEAKREAETEIYVAPVDNVQREIAETFRRVLGVERVGLHDSFFALGGHSLLAVQAHRELKALITQDIAITDLFRFPTVAALSGHLADRGKSDERLSQVADRAAMRRAALGDRRAAMQRMRGS